ncbi:peptidoglycan bridge formation glycyltransferase FemA/FemB family protein [Heliobacterium gestii]|uniref:Peptidoglycan bridge formation glycyltransferase FemA/FemB family protein n=1 Tax=Heliomicrobium gestii TaxID=2699 RepID=A0A845LCU4_HELGE|nr:peptidoglycan bridge formation glycyltransferase FemA/FemB family protein [Heliomicrobium gestii]MBM7866536.1 lipid II:glycine glycyltransferase (peptidoglycan interpeptide bridge formation enzyme) [Heliomicrobium gestii]MZP43184.1 peptidoglycan bridge formation glycyltransferase FemA/FemB family protein [Heliomicrobium gestii]
MNVRELGIQDKERFNRFMAEHPKGHVLQSWEWGDVKSRTGWQPHRLMVEEEGTPLAAVSILKRRIPALGKHIFYAPRGPVIDPARPDVADRLLEGIAALARREKAVFLKIDPDVIEPAPAWTDYLRSRGFRLVDKGEGFEGVQPRHVFRLDISDDLEQVFARFHQKTRYNIRLAEKKGVVVDENCGKEELPGFYQVLKETCERDDFLVRAYSYFEDMWDNLVPAGMAKLFIARYQGEVIAGTLAFILGDKAWYIYGASSNRHRNVMPNYLLQWKMISWAKANGCTLYDFRGVPGHVGEDHPLYGLVRFKRGFNGDYVGFIGEYDRVYQPFFYHFWNVAEPMYQNLVRKILSRRKGS